MSKIRWISKDYHRLYTEIDAELQMKMVAGLDGGTVIIIDGTPEEVVSAVVNDLCGTTTLYFHDTDKKYYVVFTVDTFEGEGQIYTHKLMYIHWRFKEANNG